MIPIINGNETGQDLSDFSPQDFSAIELAQIRQVLYQFFATLFLYPNADRLELLRNVAIGLSEEALTWMLFPFGNMLQKLLELVVELPSGENISLEEEYVRLFSVNPAAIPFESIYVDKEGLGRSLVVSHIQGEYLIAGLEPALGRVEPPDHIAVELEFLAHLVNQELESLTQMMKYETAAVRQREADFLRIHLKRWYPNFARRLKEVANEPLYGTLAQATFLFLHHELALFSLHASEC